MILIAILALPLLAAAVCGLPGSERWSPRVTLLAALANLLLAGEVALRAAGGETIVALPHWIAADGLSALIALLITAVGTSAALFSWGYMAHSTQKPRALRLYYVNFNLFLFAMLAVPLLAEPNLVWIAVELTTLFSVLLVSFADTHDALEAAWKYAVLTLSGAAIALFGFLLLFWAWQTAGGGPYSWATLRAAAGAMPPRLLQAAFLLILVGFGAKVGLVPLHTWLPDAHSQAPTPVCALLSGVETSAVLYVILRLLPLLGPASQGRAWALAFGLLSAGVASFLLLRVRDYKRLFAFSTVEQMGIVLAAAGLGSGAASYAALLQIVAHALGKSFCFYAAGSAALLSGTTKIAGVRGLLRSSPLGGSALLLGGLAIAGAPPLALFLSEFSILKAGLSGGQYLAVALLTLFIAVAFFGILRLILPMVFGKPLPQSVNRRLPRSVVLTLLLAALPLFVLGVYLPEQLSALLRAAAATLTHLAR